jgi:hypothetical protein
MLRVTTWWQVVTLFNHTSIYSRGKEFGGEFTSGGSESVRPYSASEAEVILGRRVLTTSYGGMPVDLNVALEGLADGSNSGVYNRPIKRIDFIFLQLLVGSSRG